MLRGAAAACMFSPVYLYRVCDVTLEGKCMARAVHNTYPRLITILLDLVVLLELCNYVIGGLGLLATPNQPF